MKRKSAKNIRLAFTLLLLFSFTLGFLPGSVISTSAEEVQQIADSALDTENPESILPIEDNQLDSLEEEIILDRTQEELSENTGEEEDEIIEEDIVDTEKEDNTLDDIEKEEIIEEDLNELDETVEIEEEIEEEEIDDSEEVIDEEYRFEKELEPNRPLGDSDSLIMLPTTFNRSKKVATVGLADTIAVYKTSDRIFGWRTFEVTLDITGIPQRAPVDVVLVIDRSGSMGYIAKSNKTRLYYAKQAAINFADRVLGTNGIPGSRVSVVSFSGPTTTNGNGNQNQASTDLNLSTSLTSVTTAINDISASGGTNTEAGFKQGQAVIQGTISNQNPNSNKVVIMLTDGLPTASNGNKYKDTTDINHIHIQSAITAGKNIHQNNIANVFTIGLTTGLGSTEKTLADDILTQVQNKGYYPAPSATDLDAIFTAISQSLGYAATNAKVVDKIGDNFNLIESSLPTGATYDDITREIKWNPGTIVN
ncbi:MAG: VWA domain-containing protein, partial [Clostridium sp.]|nr:VWA domain-containing protein [Clostridium sp.]